MPDCLFCKIVRGEVSSVKIYEDDEFLAFMDIYPVMKGHVLLIPKNHVEWMQDEEDSMVGKAFILTKKLMIKMKKGLSCDFVQIGVVGEAIKHFHIHLIPRYLDDNMLRWPVVKYADSEIEEYAKKITI